jgi:hypothetical protein
VSLSNDSQIELFTATSPTAAARARRRDPKTSHVAARRVSLKAGTEKAIILEFVERFPGHTATELAKLSHERQSAREFADWRYAVSKRLSDLEKIDHLVRKGAEPRICSRSGTLQSVWYDC